MSKTYLQRIFRVMAWILGILFFLGMFLITKVDRKPYQEMDYYKKTMSHLDTLSLMESSGSIWKAGWSKVNATPDTPASLVGYKPRGKYEFVQDSSFIRSIVVSNGQSQIAFLNYELMIVHPRLQLKIEEAVQQAGISLDHIYFTATHTHSGIGGYMPGLMGKIAFGGYDQNIMTMMAEKSILALQGALASQDTVSLIFQKSFTDSMVMNRLIKNDPVEPYIRQLVFQKNNGSKASFTTFSAHPTIMGSKFMGLSGDYPHYFSEKLEEEFEVVLFAAGTVGSHRAIANGNSPQDVKDYGLNLSNQLHENLIQSDTIITPIVRNADLPLALRKAHYKIGKNVRLRPWVFNSLFGETNAHFDIVRLGNTLMVSSSGEISGVFMEAWEKYAEEQGLHLIITCFNGGYIGYITPDQYYDEKLYEVREMNWFGPYNGAYFDEIIRKIIQKAI